MIFSTWIDDDEILKHNLLFNEKFPDGHQESMIRPMRNNGKVEWVAENRWGGEAVLATLERENGKLKFTTIKD